jgi:hypothetical protein
MSFVVPSTPVLEAIFIYEREVIWGERGRERTAPRKHILSMILIPRPPDLVRALVY